MIDGSNYRYFRVIPADVRYGYPAESLTFGVHLDPKEAEQYRSLRSDQQQGFMARKVIDQIRKAFNSTGSFLGNSKGSYPTRKVIVESLGTKDPAEAEQKASVLKKRDDRLFHELRLIKANALNLSNEERMEKAFLLVQNAKKLADLFVDQNSVLDELRQERQRSRMMERYILKMSGHNDIDAFLESPQDANTEVATLALQTMKSDGTGEQPSGLRLKKCLELYLDDLKRKGVGDSSERAWKKIKSGKTTAVDVLIKVAGGDKEISSITREHVRLVKKELEERTKPQKLKVSAINVYIANLRAFFNFALTEIDSDKRNPFDNMKDEDPEAPNEKRDSFSFDQAKLILARLDQETNWETKAIGWLTALTGARLKEITLLDAADIKIQDDVPHILIQANAHRKRLKTKVSKRSIPLVPRAIEILQKCPTSGAIFPECVRTPDPAGLLSDRFSYFLREKMEITDEKLAWHSWRHYVKNCLINTGASEMMQNAILGHSQKGMSGTYGEGFDLPNKQKALGEALALLLKKIE
ncbi:tyrosine-type recombinase/integrase [Labrys miyagiensis]|nr:tyrosine-type recombinase/integrase [Labrys miyagiensis]